ncbi:MAG: DUF2889 domain-containing protein [Alphaproteobacteria bacterium]|nr:DUF2889 domain-containing protein [Alphaproteobacteria bacterium]
MPLSSPAPRERMHTRRIEINGYLRADGMWDIEARLVDEKSYGFDNQWRGRVEPGMPVHDMWIRLTIDDDKVVHAVETSTEAGPYPICPQVAPNFQALKGLKIGPGWNNRVKVLLGGAKGCTHLVALLGPVASIAYQTQSSTLMKRKGKADPWEATGQKASASRPKPWYIDSCLAYATDGEVVKKNYPEFYTGK